MARAEVAELHARWQQYGCAICGRVASVYSPDGFKVELHHLDGRPSRGAGGPWAIDPNRIIGLCGSLAPNRCHWKVTEHRIELVEEDARLRWIDRETGETDYCRRLPIAASAPMVEEGRAGRDQTVVTGSAPLDPSVGEPVAPPAAIAGAGPPSPGAAPALGRFERLKRALTAWKRLTLELAAELKAARDGGDAEVLGVDWPTYYSNLGLSKSQVSKMLAVADAFGERWKELPPAAQDELSLERMYAGALLMRAQGLPADEVLEAVTQHPTEQLIAMRTGKEPQDRHPCTCPQCGREVWHSPE